VLAWLAIALTWFVTLQIRPLLDPDEGRYAEIPREMLASGDWVTPRLDGLLYFEKPPLQYWATAAAYAVFGESEWTSRLWAVGLGLACLGLVYLWTRREYGERAGRAALVALAVSPYFVIVAHLNLLDSGFTFWLIGVVFAFCLAQGAAPGSAEERRWMLATWLAAALAVLSKGIVVGVLAGVALVAYSVLERDARPWKRLHLVAGVPLFLCVTAPWFVLVSERNPGFLKFFFVHEHFARFLTKVHQRYEPWWYFIPIMLVATLPWLVTLVRRCRGAWADAPRPDARFRPLRFLLIFAATTFVFFSVSDSKLAPYVLPIIPVLAAVVGSASSERVRSISGAASADGTAPGTASSAAGGVTITGGTTSSTASSTTSGTTSGTIITGSAWAGAWAVTVVALGLLFYSWHRNGVVPLSVWLWSLAAVVVAWAGALRVRSVTDPYATGVVVAVAVSAIAAWQFLLCAFAATPPPRSARDLVAAVRPYVHPNTQLYSVGQFRQTILPYLRRTVTVVGYEGELSFGLHADGGKGAATLDEFASRWSSSSDAVAFIAPSDWPILQKRGLPGRVIAADSETVVVDRQ